MKYTVINHQINFWSSSKYVVMGKDPKVLKAQGMKLIRQVSVNSDFHNLNEVDISLFIYLNWLLPHLSSVKFYSTRSDLFWNWYTVTISAYDQFPAMNLFVINACENSYSSRTNENKLMETLITILPRKLKLLQKLLRNEAVDYYLTPASFLLRYKIENTRNPKSEEILFRFAGLPLRFLS